MPRIIKESTFEELLEKQKELISYYLPLWKAGSNGEDGDYGVALMKIFAHMQEEIISRINRVPEKKFAAYLDMIGIVQASAVPAKVPLTFYLTEGLQENVFILGKTQVANSAAADQVPLTYETCKGFTASKACIEEIFSLDPTSDRIFSHIEDLKAGREFQPLTGQEEDNLQRHALYLGHNNLFSVKGQAEITLIIELNMPVSSRDWDDLSWSYWGETGFIAFAEKRVEQIDKNEHVDGRSWHVILKSRSEIKESSINGIKSFWICCELKSRSRTWDSTVINYIKIEKVISSLEGIKPDLGYHNFFSLDVNRTFYPFGRQPGQFDAFYLASKEVFSKKEARIEIKFKGSSPIEPVLSWEYWNGTSWSSLDVKHTENDGGFRFNSSVNFTCPKDLLQSEFCSEVNYWIRALLIKGNFQAEISNNNIKTIIEDKTKDESDKIQEIFEIAKSWALRPQFDPPKVDSISISYSIDRCDLDYCLAYNNMDYDNFAEICKCNSTFGLSPFVMLPYSQPTLFLGFNNPFDKGNMSLFFSLKGHATSVSEIEWYYLGKPTVANGLEIEKRLDTIDNTNNLTRSDALEFLGPYDQERIVKFGRDCYWLVGHQKHGQQLPAICRIYPNTVWAEQVESYQDEILGSGDAEMNGKYRFMRRPVIAPEIWVREEKLLSGEERDSLSSEGIEFKDITDESGRVVDTWIKWRCVADLYDSGPNSRHYVLDGATGEATFGNGIYGMIPPRGTDNILASYKTSEGSRGNTGKGEINLLKSGIAGVERVTNNEPASGGSDAETLQEVLLRGPHLIRHRDRAVTIEDFERLAQESSSAIARARCFMDQSRLKVIVIPETGGDMPLPSSELLKVVKRHLLERALITMPPSRIEISGPAYIKVNVSVEVYPKSIEMAVPMQREVSRRLKEFFHPLAGGFDRNGWTFGRDVHLSDLYRLLEGIAGIDHVENLRLCGQRTDLSIGDEEMVCSGEHDIIIKLGD